MRRVVKYSNWLLLLSIVLAGALALHCSQTLAPYRRDDWKHWIDADNDCQTTRVEVLIREGRDVILSGGKHCKVIRGRWLDPYSGTEITDPTELDIDHVVALHHAHTHGGDRWSRERKEAFANELSDPRHLRAVSDDLNRAKSDKGPDQWLPPNLAYQCQYVRDWVAIKARWQLSITRTEQATIDRVERERCPVEALQ